MSAKTRTALSSIPMTNQVVTDISETTSIDSSSTNDQVPTARATYNLVEAKVSDFWGSKSSGSSTVGISAPWEFTNSVKVPTVNSSLSDTSAASTGWVTNKLSTWWNAIKSSTQAISSIWTFSSGIVASLIKSSLDSSAVSIFGGTALNKGASASFCGKDKVDEQGYFRIKANDGTNSHELVGKPNGDLEWSGTLKTNIEGSVSKLATTRTFCIKDADSEHQGDASYFDGSADVVLKLPKIIRADILGEAGSAIFTTSAWNQKEKSSIGHIAFWVGTATDYNDIKDKNPNILYIITG